MSASSSANVDFPAPSTPSIATLATRSGDSRAIRSALTFKTRLRSAKDLRSTIETIRASVAQHTLHALHSFEISAGAVTHVKVCADLVAAFRKKVHEVRLPSCGRMGFAPLALNGGKGRHSHRWASTRGAAASHASKPVPRGLWPRRRMPRPGGCLAPTLGQVCTHFDRG